MQVKTLRQEQNENAAVVEEDEVILQHQFRQQKDNMIN